MDGWEEHVPDGKPASSRALRLQLARLEQREPGLGWGGAVRWLDHAMLESQTLHFISINFLLCFLDFGPQTNLDVMTMSLDSDMSLPVHIPAPSQMQILDQHTDHLRVIFLICKMGMMIPTSCWCPSCSEHSIDVSLLFWLALIFPLSCPQQLISCQLLSIPQLGWRGSSHGHVSPAPGPESLKNS